MKLTWDEIGAHFYKVGVDRGVLYPMVDDVYQNGVPWSGITGVEYSPSGREKTVLYTGDIRSRILLSPEEFGGSISAYFYPDAFDPCIGDVEAFEGMIIGQQERQPFGLSYRTRIGNDIDGNNYGYKLHVLYNSLVVTLKDTESTINESLSPSEFNWTFECIPVPFGSYSPVSHIGVDSRKLPKVCMEAVEKALWGSDENEPYLPSPEELYNIILGALPFDEYPYPRELLYPSLDIYPTT